MKKILLFFASIMLCTIVLFSCGEEQSTTYTVTFDTSGGNSIASVAVNEGETVAAPTEPTKEYSTFRGWYNGDRKFDFSTPITSDIVIKAKWDRDQYRVNFDTAGGSFIHRVKVYGGELVDKPVDPTKTNYEFDGWYVGDEKYDFSASVTADITLVAKWKFKGYTVRFDTDGGTSIPSQSVESLATRPDDPERSGYLFEGWYIDKKQYDFSTVVTKDITIKAKWRMVIADDSQVFDRMQSVLLIGQSNMEGGDGLGTVDPISDDRLYMLRDEGWVKMQEPIHIGGGVGLGASFGKAFVETFNVGLGLIPAARGGTSLYKWRVGGELYNNAIALAKKAQETTDICAILWHQGCSDQDDPFYAEKLKVILNAMLEELGLDSSKIIIVTGELYGTRGDKMHSAQLKLLYDEYENYAIAKSDGLTVYDEDTHFTGPSQRVFGYRYFALFYYLKTGKEFTDFDNDPESYKKQ